MPRVADDPEGYYKAMEWLMFQMGHIGPMLGQTHHFRTYAPEKIAYAIDRYTNEAKRLYGVVDKRLSHSAYLGGDDYTIADIATFPWLRNPEGQGQNLEDFPHLKRWFDAIAARPAVIRGVAVLPEMRRPGPIQQAEREVLFGATQHRDAEAIRAAGARAGLTRPCTSNFAAGLPISGRVRFGIPFLLGGCEWVLGHAQWNFHHGVRRRPPSPRGRRRGQKQPTGVTMFGGRIVLLRQPIQDFLGTLAIMRETGKSKTCVWRWQALSWKKASRDCCGTRPALRIAPLSAGQGGRNSGPDKKHSRREAPTGVRAGQAEAAGVSVSSVQRVWRAHGLQPRSLPAPIMLQGSRILRLQDIVGLYMDRARPTRWCCLSTKKARSRPSTAPSPVCR